MKRALLLMLLALALLVAPAPAIGQQVVGVCLLDFGRYPEHWGITAGIPDAFEYPFVWYFSEVITDPNFSSPYGDYYDNYVSMFSELRHVSPVHPFSLKSLNLQIDVYGKQLSDVLIYVSLYRRIGGQDVLVWEEQRTITNQSELGRGRIMVQPGDVVADFVVVHAYQPSIGDVPAAGFSILVDEICVNVMDVLATVTPGGGWATLTPTGVGGVTNTPVPTVTRTYTSTPTLTRTPSPYPTLPPTKTKTPTIAPTRQPTSTGTATATNTPLPSNTPLPPSNTPLPTATYTPGGPTVTPSNTPLPPSATPTSPPPTLGSGAFNTPPPPDSDCRDVLNPCPLFEVPRIPTLQLPSPTPISLLPGRPTAYASITMVAMATADGTRTSDQSVPWATQMSNIQDIMELKLTQTFLNMQGTPVDGANGIYEIGSQVGSLVCVARSVGESDLGRVGGLLVFLVLAIVFNFSLRVFMPIVKIVVRVVKLILTAIGAIK